MAARRRRGTTRRSHRLLPREQTGAGRLARHALRAVRPIRRPALWTGEPSYLANIREWLALWDEKTRQPHGVTVADEQYGWAGPLRGTETCDVAGDILLNATMASIAGEGQFGDRAERSFFNAGAACVSRDFMHHVYFQTPNRPDNSDVTSAVTHSHGGNGCY